MTILAPGHPLQNPPEHLPEQRHGSPSVRSRSFEPIQQAIRPPPWHLMPLGEQQELDIRAQTTVPATPKNVSLLPAPGRSVVIAVIGLTPKLQSGKDVSLLETPTTQETPLKWHNTVSPAMAVKQTDLSGTACRLRSPKPPCNRRISGKGLRRGTGQIVDHKAPRRKPCKDHCLAIQFKSRSRVRRHILQKRQLVTPFPTGEKGPGPRPPRPGQGIRRNHCIAARCQPFDQSLVFQRTRPRPAMAM